MKIFRLMHYPPETMNIMLLARIIATIQMADDKESVFNTFMQVCLSVYIDSCFGEENNSYCLISVLSFVSQ